MNRVNRVKGLNRVNRSGDGLDHNITAHNISGRNNGSGGEPGERYQPDNDLGMIFLYVNAIMVALILLSNLGVFYAFLKMKRSVKEKVPNILLLNQAVVDFTIGITTIPRMACLDGGCLQTTFSTYKFFSEYSMFLAVGTLIVCTAERFLCIKYPLYHHRYITKRIVIILIVLTWLINVTPGFVLLFFIMGTLVRVWTYYIVTAAYLLFGVTLVFGLLGATYWAIRQSISERIRSVQSATGETVSRTVSDTIALEEKKQSKVTKVFFLMSIIYAVTILPILVGQLVLESMQAAMRTAYTAKQSLYLFYILSSLINPFLTLKCKPDYTDALLHCCKGRGGSKKQPVTVTLSVSDSRV